VATGSQEDDVTTSAIVTATSTSTSGSEDGVGTGSGVATNPDN